MELSVKEGQSILDIVVQQFGSLDNLADFIDDNPDLDFNSNLDNGQLVQINADGLGDENVKGFYVRSSRDSNNADPPEDTAFGGDYNNDYNNDYN